MQTKSFNLELKALEETGRFEGYASVFNVTDLGDDIVVPGAFSKSIESRPQVPLLWNHSHGEVIGAIRSMQEDPKGLKVTGEIALDTTRGKEAYSLLKKEMMKGLSIGYLVVKDSIEAGKRILKELELMEVSIVAVPMNTFAGVTSVKGENNSTTNTNRGKTSMENIEQLSRQIGELVTELKSHQAEARKQIVESGDVSTKLKSEIENIQTAITELNQKFVTVEQKLNPAPLAGGNDNKTPGERFVESKNFQNFVSGGFSHSGTVQVGSLWGTKAITGIDTIGPKMNAGLVSLPMQRVFVRNFLNVQRTSESSIEFVKQTSFTNNAAIQYVSPSYENVSKGESDMAFTLATAPVRTVAHFAKASKQVLADIPQMTDLINTQLLAGLRIKEEKEILTGDGTAGHLNGLVAQATAYDTGLNVVGDTAADLLLHAIYQVSLANVVADAIFAHPSTVHKLMALKTTGTASSGEYIFSNPASTTTVPTVWGLPLVGTLSMTSGAFLVGSFSTGATLYDREDASVAVSTEDSDNFTKNMVTVLGEERIALAVKMPGAFIYGTGA